MNRNAPVAQLDRALPSEGKGHTFESCRVRHKVNDLAKRSDVSESKTHHKLTKNNPAFGAGSAGDCRSFFVWVARPISDEVPSSNLALESTFAIPDGAIRANSLKPSAIMNHRFASTSRKSARLALPPDEECRKRAADAKHGDDRKDDGRISCMVHEPSD